MKEVGGGGGGGSVWCATIAWCMVTVEPCARGRRCWPMWANAVARVISACS
jgi:hypothetical protein